MMIRSMPEGDPGRGYQPPGQEPNQGREDGGGNDLGPEMRLHRGARIMAGLGILLAAHAPGQDREEHDPPDEEIDDEGRQKVHACSSSIRLPRKSLGCRNRTGLPWAPVLGSPSPSTRAPLAFSRSRAARISSTS